MKILLVDDHPLFREGVGLLLRSLIASDVHHEAGTCDEALQILREYSEVGLVLMDIHLPGTSGISGIETIRREFPRIPVVALSSSDDRGTIFQAIDAGAMGFIPKTSSSAVLLAALQLVLANGIYLPREILREESASITRREPGTGSVRAAGTTPEQLGLTPRQAEVLFLVLQGKSAKAISRDLALSTSTVKIHTSAALRALNVTTRTQAVIAAGRLGLCFSEHLKASGLHS